MAGKFDHLSDEELSKIALGAAPAQAPQDLSHLSDDDLIKIASSKSGEPKTSTSEAALIGLQKGTTFGFRPALAGAAGAAGSFYENLKNISLPGEGLTDKFKRSFNSISPAYEDARKGAIAEQDQAQADHPLATAAGDIAGSALTIPFAAGNSLNSAAKLAALQGTGKAISEGKNYEDALNKLVEGTATGLAGYGLGKSLEAAAPYVGKALGVVGDKSRAGIAKLASALTGETEKNFSTLINEHDTVNKLIQEGGGDVSGMADKFREKLMGKIQKYRAENGAKIGAALDALSKEKEIESTPIIASLEKVKARISPNLKPEEVGQIDDLILRVKAEAGETGKLTPRELYNVQDFLGDRAKSSYQKAGQIFVPGKDAQLAAKYGAREAKITLDKLAPELRDANSNLFQLHRIEENINKNLIAPGKPEAALLAAGGATTGRNRKNLEVLGKTIGSDVVGDAEKLSAAAAFSNQSLLPKSFGGTTSTSRTGVGAGLGALIGGLPGAITAGAATSPVVWQKGIQGAGAVKALGSKLLNSQALDAAGRVVGSQQGLTAIGNEVSGARDSAIRRRMQVIEDLMKKRGG